MYLDNIYDMIYKTSLDIDVIILIVSFNQNVNFKNSNVGGKNIKKNYILRDFFKGLASLVFDSRMGMKVTLTALSKKYFLFIPVWVLCQMALTFLQRYGYVTTLSVAIHVP